MALLRDQGNKDFIGRYSSFQSVDRTLGVVVERLLKSERLKRLLYYTDKHALKLPKLTQEQTLSLLNDQIKIVPKLNVDFDAKPYVLIMLDDFLPNDNQTTFRSFRLQFTIICRFEDWLLDDFKLRPYAIAGEIDGLINTSFSTGFGIADFLGAKQLILEDMGGLSLYYNVETFTDDTKLNPPE